MASLCFQIHGEHLTNLSRNLVLEGRFDKGYEMLYEGLDGISSDQVFGILKGEYKLEGINDVLMTEDDGSFTKEWKEIYGGVWKTFEGRYLQPYAVVTSWGPDDVGSMSDYTKDSDRSYRQYYGPGSDCPQEVQGRSLFYADDPKLDVVKQLTLSGYESIPRNKKTKCVSVLFKEIHNFPNMIMKASDTAQAALDEWIQFHHLYERGYKDTFPAEVFKQRYDSQDISDVPPPCESQFDFGGNSKVDRKLGAYRCDVIQAEANKVDVETVQAYNKAMVTTNRENVNSFYEKIRVADKAISSLDEYKKIILERAKDNYLTITFKGNDIKIPQAPFEQWSLWRTDGAHLAMPWEKVCPSGMKMFNDDPFHTDFMVGAGLGLNAMDDSELSEIIYELRFKVQKEKMNFKATVLSGSGSVHGKIIHPKIGDQITSEDIIVIPAASPDYVELAMKAKATICEKGGSMAHLISVGRENNLIIVRVPDSRKLYPVGSKVDINADKGLVILNEGPMKSNLFG